MKENTVHVVGTDLLDYSLKIEELIKQGYCFSTSNEYAPRAWPHMFEAWMILSPKDEEGLPYKGNSFQFDNNSKAMFGLKDEVETVVKLPELTSIASKDTSQLGSTKNESEGVVARSNTVVADKTTKKVNRRGRK